MSAPATPAAFEDALAHLLSEFLDAAPCTEEHFVSLLRYAHKMWLLVEGATTAAFVSLVVPAVAPDALKAKLAFGLLFEAAANEHGVVMKEAPADEPHGDATDA